MKNSIYIIIACLVFFSIGFFLGRKTINEKTEVKYIREKPLSYFIPFPVAIKEIVPDTIILIEYDTILTIIDWNIKRNYSEMLFDNQNGSLLLDATVQYNRLQDLSYTFTPIRKEMTQYKRKTWIPFVGTSYNTFNYLSISGGLFYQNIGIETQFITDFQKKGWGIGFKYKF